MTETSLNEESITFFRNFLKDESGYNLLPGKEYFLTSRLKSVMEVHNLPNYDAIITKIRFNKRGPVATDVIEATTVNETFFFRDDKPFEVFRETVMPRLREIAKTRPIKIWSAACSTGQEPYSIAIILEEEKRKKRRRYDSSFKSNILQLHKDGRSIGSLALSFGISEQLLYRWRRESKKETSNSLGVEIEEVKLLRKQVKDLEIEREILKKALGIFSRGH